MSFGTHTLPDGFDLEEYLDAPEVEKLTQTQTVALIEALGTAKLDPSALLRRASPGDIAVDITIDTTEAEVAEFGARVNRMVQRDLERACKRARGAGGLPATSPEPTPADKLHAEADARMKEDIRQAIFGPRPIKAADLVANVVTAQDLACGVLSVDEARARLGLLPVRRSEHYEKLLAALKEGAAIARGEAAPARAWKVEGGKVTEVTPHPYRYQQGEQLLHRGPVPEPAPLPCAPAGIVTTITLPHRLPSAPEMRARPRQLLASHDNPDGWRLADLVQQLKREVYDHRPKMKKNRQAYEEVSDWLDQFRDEWASFELGR